MDRGVDQGPWLQERVGGGRRGWMAVSQGHGSRRMGGVTRFGWGGYPRSWPGGQGGTGLGGRRGWMALPKKGLVGCFKKWQGVGGPRLGLGAGSKGFGARGGRW